MISLPQESAFRKQWITTSVSFALLKTKSSPLWKGTSACCGKARAGTDGKFPGRLSLHLPPPHRSSFLLRLCCSNSFPPSAPLTPPSPTGSVRQADRHTCVSLGWNHTSLLLTCAVGQPLSRGCEHAALPAGALPHLLTLWKPRERVCCVPAGSGTRPWDPGSAVRCPCLVWI